MTRPRRCVDGPDNWPASVPVTAGSWWPAWHAWLSARGRGTSTVERAAHGRALPPLRDAPGRYALKT
ncbi:MULTISPECIES: hypothetical protein [Ralstonia solanacearum species complex]|uniref:hypothetical protein n=1 Tax=Ralstonia solanacearum species complex TaxID=3116862 RepID=UPI000ADB3A53